MALWDCNRAVNHAADEVEPGRGVGSESSRSGSAASHPCSDSVDRTVIPAQTIETYR